MRYSALFGLAAAAAVISASAYFAPVQAASIYTGGEKGAYHTIFCPPIPDALASEYFYDYTCTPTNGTVDNIAQVLANPTDIGLAQFDVFARHMQSNPGDAGKLVVIRQLACEGLWAVTKNDRVNNFGDILGLSRRMPFVIGPDGSGGKATFQYLQTLDPNLGVARNVVSEKDTTSIINKVAGSGRGEVGFFVQFADPTNPNIQLVVEKELKVVPVISRELVNAEYDGQKLYEVQTFELSSGGIFTDGIEITTTCTPVVIFTGAPDSIADPALSADQRDMIEAIKTIPDEAMLPEQDFLAKIISGAKRLTDTAVEELVAGVEKAKNLVDENL